MRHLLAAIASLVFTLIDFTAAHAQQRYFQIRVVNAATSAPIPCAVARALTGVEYTTDRNGNIAFYEPALMGVRTWFTVGAPGYEHPADGFGSRGRAVTPSSGGSAEYRLNQIGSPAPCSAGSEQTERLAGTVPTPTQRFGIRLVNAMTGRGVPIVELRWPGGFALSDNAGWVALDDPAIMNRATRFELRAHGYRLEDPAGGNAFTLTPAAGGRVDVLVEPVGDQIAQRLYRITGADLYRESVLLGHSAPIARPLLNTLIVGQDSVQTAVYRGKLFWTWGDTGSTYYPLGNFRGTAATSLLPSAGGLDPEIGVNLDYYAAANGFSKQIAPASTLPNPPGDDGSLAAWLGSMTVARDAANAERLLVSYALLPGLTDPHEEGFALFDDAEAVFKKALVFDSATMPAIPRGESRLVRHGAEDWAYFNNDVRVRAQYPAVLDPQQWQAFTPLRSGSSGAIDRDAQGRALYRFRSNAAPITPAIADALGLPAAQRLFGQLREPSTGHAPAEHATTLAWNAQRGRYVQMIAEIFGSPSLLGEIWYAEGDTPMGPWVYVRKVVTHDNYSFYNPRLHPYFDEEGGRRIFFEATYTASFTDAVPTPRAEYNQVMYQLELDDPRLALPVPIYDLGGARPGDFTGKAGLRRGQSAGIAPFMAFDRAAPGAVPVYWSSAACRERTLLAGGTAITPPLFWALPAGQSPAPPDAVPLYRYRNASTRQEAYSIDPQLALPGYSRVGTVALVFRNPIAVTLPVVDYLPSLLAHAGSDGCAQELAPGAGVVVALDGKATSHLGGTVARYTWRYRVGGVEQTASGAAPRVRLPAGLHAIELTAEGSDGAVSRDQVLVSIAAATTPFTLSCAAQGLPYEASFTATPFLDGYAYALQSVRGPGGSTSPSGWLLHHRPAQGFPNNHFDPDVIVRDGAVLGYSLWNGLVPQTPSMIGPPVALSSATCPGGGCVLSFERGCELTYGGPSAGAKVAVTGDSLIWGPALCGFGPPPEGCAPSLTQLLVQRGSRVWSRSEPGQSFVSWLDVVREQATTAPDVHVLALGTNDAGGQAGAAPGQPREDRAWQTVGAVNAGIQAIRSTNPAACIVLVTVSEKTLLNGQINLAYRDEARRVNDLIAYFDTGAGLPNIQVADWATSTRAHCPSTWLTSATTTCDWFGSDQLHMVRAGNEARNALILDAIARCGQ